MTPDARCVPGRQRTSTAPWTAWASPGSARAAIAPWAAARWRPTCARRVPRATSAFATAISSRPTADHWTLHIRRRKARQPALNAVRSVGTSDSASGRARSPSRTTARPCPSGCRIRPMRPRRRAAASRARRWPIHSLRGATRAHCRLELSPHILRLHLTANPLAGSETIGQTEVPAASGPTTAPDVEASARRLERAVFRHPRVHLHGPSCRAAHARGRRASHRATGRGGQPRVGLRSERARARARAERAAPHAGCDSARALPLTRTR